MNENQTPLQVWTNFITIVVMAMVIAYLVFRTFNYLELKLDNDRLQQEIPTDIRASIE
jgi:hypothetical protein